MHYHLADTLTLQTPGVLGALGRRQRLDITIYILCWRRFSDDGMPNVIGDCTNDKARPGALEKISKPIVRK